MSKEQIVLFYSVSIILIILISFIIFYLKDKKINALMKKIKKLDEIYFDEIEEISKIINQEKIESKQ